MVKESQLRASRNYRKKVQNDEAEKQRRNKRIAFRAARSYINRYDDMDELKELKSLIDAKINK